MTIRIGHLSLLCRKSEERIDFADRVSFFHGEMSTGKSTIVEAVSYCLGGSMTETPAVKSELVGVQLEATFDETSVLVERSLSTKTSLDVAWKSPSEQGRETLPLAAAQQPIVGDDIYSFSDFILRQIGFPLLKVRRRKDDPDSELQRLSFRDFFKFCYLDQPDLDSSFFELETPIRMEKSKDVLKYVLGFHSDRLNALQSELADVRMQQRSMRDAANQIREFLGRYGFSSEEDISKEIDELDAKAEELEKEIERQDTPGDLKVTVSEDDQTRVRTLSEDIEAKKDAISEIVMRVREQESLVAEFISMKFKAARSSTASELLSGATFHACPACGTAVGPQKAEETCVLCKSDLRDAPGVLAGDSAVLEQDLTDRIEDLKRSITRLKRSLDRQRLLLEGLVEQRQTSLARVDQAKRQQESEYMQRARQLEAERGANRERRRLLVRIKEMPSEVDNKLHAANELSLRISELGREIEQEQERFAEGRKNVAALESNFHALLQAIHFPEITSDDFININQRTWLPHVLPKGNEKLAWTFSDAGSGGKMVLFKICFALALHLTCAQRNLPLPKILIIDSPMKNITPDINPEVFEYFYQELYRLLNSELGEWQCILVDQTYHEAPEGFEGLTHRRMTKNEPEHLPLISYYKGH